MMYYMVPCPYITIATNIKHSRTKLKICNKQLQLICPLLLLQVFSFWFSLLFIEYVSLNWNFMQTNSSFGILFFYMWYFTEIKLQTSLYLCRFFSSCFSCIKLPIVIFYTLKTIKCTKRFVLTKFLDKLSSKCRMK